MDLKIDRTQNTYELNFNGVVLAQSTELTEIMAKAEKYAKKFQKKILISTASVSDWYVGFPVDKEQAPVVFFDSEYQVKASTPQDYRFVEGPFLNQTAACDAAFKISGQQARVVTNDVPNI